MESTNLLHNGIICQQILLRSVEFHADHSQYIANQHTNHDINQASTQSLLRKQGLPCDCLSYKLKQRSVLTNDALTSLRKSCYWTNYQALKPAE